MIHFFFVDLSEMLREKGKRMRAVCVKGMRWETEGMVHVGVV
jgi:hypothetical protein